MYTFPYYVRTLHFNSKISTHLCFSFTAVNVIRVPSLSEEFAKGPVKKTEGPCNYRLLRNLTVD